MIIYFSSIKLVMKMQRWRVFGFHIALNYFIYVGFKIDNKNNIIN